MHDVLAGMAWARVPKDYVLVPKAPLAWRLQLGLGLPVTGAWSHVGQDDDGGLRVQELADEDVRLAPDGWAGWVSYTAG